MSPCSSAADLADAVGAMYPVETEDARLIWNLVRAGGSLRIRARWHSTPGNYESPLAERGDYDCLFNNAPGQPTPPG